MFRLFLEERSRSRDSEERRLCSRSAGVADDFTMFFS